MDTLFSLGHRTQFRNPELLAPELGPFGLGQLQFPFMLMAGGLAISVLAFVKEFLV